MNKKPQWQIGQEVWYLLKYPAHYRMGGPVRIVAIDRAFPDLRLRLSDSTATRLPARYVYANAKAAQEALAKLNRHPAA